MLSQWLKHENNQLWYRCSVQSSYKCKYMSNRWSFVEVNWRCLPVMCLPTWDPWPYTIVYMTRTQLDTSRSSQAWWSFTSDMSRFYLCALYNTVIKKTETTVNTQQQRSVLANLDLAKHYYWSPDSVKY